MNDPNEPTARPTPRAEFQRSRLREEREYRLLVQLAARAEMRRKDSPFYADERFIGWLDNELRGPHRAAEGWSEERVAHAARRMRAQAAAARLRVACPAGWAPSEPLGAPGTVAQLRAAAARERWAPDLEQAAAAGAGRELWDEPCETRTPLPSEAPEGEYFTMKVAGDSMEPLFHHGDKVLVKLGPQMEGNTVVVARTPDGAHVVKRVGRVTRTALELTSLNPGYAPIRVPRRRNAVVGTVVLRWCPHEVAVPGR